MVNSSSDGGECDDDGDVDDDQDNGDDQDIGTFFRHIVITDQQVVTEVNFNPCRL